MQIDNTSSIYSTPDPIPSDARCRADLLHVGAAQPRKGSTCNISDADPGPAKHTLPPNRSALAASRESLNTGAACATPAGVLYNVLTAQLYIAGCKKWKCEPCGKRKAKELLHRLKGYRFERLITLTAPANTQATRENVKSFNYAWKLFKQWLVRQHSKVLFDYLWANESGKRTGQLHKHIALPWFRFDYKAARAAMKEISKRAMLGVVCDFGKPRPLKWTRDHRALAPGLGMADSTREKANNSPLRNQTMRQGPVSYCLSYVVKDRGEMPRHARRVQTSVRRQVEKQAGWCFLPSWAPKDVHPEWMLDTTTAEAIGIARQYLAEYLAELALMQEEKQHAAFLERADAGLEVVK